MNTLGLEHLAGRCANGFDIATQHDASNPHACPCDVGEWPTFLAAIRKAVRPDGTVSNNDLRPHLQVIPHKHRGLLYRKATSAGVLELIRDRREPSTDTRGKNTDKDAKFYAVRSAAA